MTATSVGSLVIRIDRPWYGGQETARAPGEFIGGSLCAAEFGALNLNVRRRTGLSGQWFTVPPTSRAKLAHII
jgi:hypothetical protein